MVMPERIVPNTCLAATVVILVDDSDGVGMSSRYKILRFGDLGDTALRA